MDNQLWPKLFTQHMVASDSFSCCVYKYVMQSIHMWHSSTCLYFRPEQNGKGVSCKYNFPLLWSNKISVHSPTFLKGFMNIHKSVEKIWPRTKSGVKEIGAYVTGPLAESVSTVSLVKCVQIYLWDIWCPTWSYYFLYTSHSPLSVFEALVGSEYSTVIHLSHADAITVSRSLYTTV